MKRIILFVGLIAMASADTSSVLKESNNQFTAKMFDEVVKANQDKSVILSAFSVLTPLAELGLSSVGPSHDEILGVMALPNDNVTKEVFKGVNANMRSIKGVEFKMANRVYIAKDAELNQEFAALSSDVFKSDIINIDFASNPVQTANEINTWVEEQTNSKIKDLVDSNSLQEATRALLVNAIYFKGSWKNQFDKSLTKDGDFHVTKDKTVQVPMMNKKAQYRYGESAVLDAKLLELPYEGGESSFLIVLPNKIDGLSTLLEKLKDPNAVTKASNDLYSTEVIVTMPKFKIETTTDLKALLQNMGVKKIFNAGEAHLSNLLKNESNLYISDAIQKAFIEVNEEGAEAAAANEEFTYAKSSAFFNPHENFNADHPFYFELQLGEQKLFCSTYFA